MLKSTGEELNVLIKCANLNIFPVEERSKAKTLLQQLGMELWTWSLQLAMIQVGAQVLINTIMKATNIMGWGKIRIYDESIHLSLSLSLVMWSFHWWNPLGIDTISYFTVALKLFSCFIDVPSFFLISTSKYIWPGIFISHCKNNTLIQFLDSLACYLEQSQNYMRFLMQICFANKQEGRQKYTVIVSFQNFGQNCSWLLVCT